MLQDNQGKEMGGLVSCKAVIFDMDGTLLDTLDDIACSMNTTLAELGYPPHERDAYKGFVGAGIDAMAAKVLPKDARTESNISRCIALMRREYSKRWAGTTRPYPGIPKLLDTLNEKGVMMSVLSNKIDSFTKEMAGYFLGSWVFGEVLGLNPDAPAKPDPSSALSIARNLGVRPDQCIFVGDSDIDMMTAVRAGMLPAGALWGYQNEQRLVSGGAGVLLGAPLDLLRYLE